MKRLLYILFLIGAGVQVSFFGGNISYLLFYFALLLPVIALAYSIYVYLRFKIVQDTERTVVKAQKVPYYLRLANEDVIPFTNISLNYFTEKVTLRETEEEIKHMCLLPGEHKQINTKMYCKYRGIYAVGVKSVTVTDFFGMFTITYPMREQIRVTVKPRILPFELFEKSIERHEPKNSRFATQKKQDIPDFELRRYCPGDSMKYIHWKNSAKAGELLVRKQMPEEMFEITVLMDLSPVREFVKEKLEAEIEDDIVETAVSFAYHYCLKKIPVRVVFMQKEISDYVIGDSREFNKFYNFSPNVTFCAKLPPEEVWKAYIQKVNITGPAVWVTSSVTDGIRQSIEENRKAGVEIVLIDTGELQL